MPRYSFESEGDERALFNAPSTPETSQERRQRQPQSAIPYYPPSSGSRRSNRPRYDVSPSRPGMPGAHPDSAFSQLRANRMSSQDVPENSQNRSPYMAAGVGAGVAADAPPSYSQAQTPNPIPGTTQGYRRHDPGYYPPLNNTTPGADNFSDAAAGGVAGIAYSIAERNARESGIEAMTSPNYPQPAHQSQQPYGRGGDGNYAHDQPPQTPLPGPTAYTPGGAAGDRDSNSSLQGLNAAAIPMAESTPGHRSRSPGYATSPYSDNPYQGYTGYGNQRLGLVDPNDIYDDGDDGLEYGRRGPGNSMLSLGQSSSRGGHNGKNGAAAVAGGAAAGTGVLATLGGLVGRGASSRDGNGQYDAVQNQNTNTAYQGDSSAYDLGSHGEKSAWLAKQGTSAKRWKWAIIGGIGLLIAVAIALGVYFGVVRNQNAAASSGGESAADDTSKNGDLSINSPEIKALLNNKNLHKVFPGIDYTPINTQYPSCLDDPPSPNNVTRDVAVLSQLTNTIRLYGTDCNQTEMLIHAVSQLQMNDTIKIWMGVWQDNNKTTNARQLAQMWDILEKYGDSPFKGVIVANEILYRQQMTVTELGDLLESVRDNITSKGMSLPVATSDLGTDWTESLASKSDYIMANIHPFFGGVNADDAASWTYSFWEDHNSAFFKSDASKNVIAETGWPSQGGMDCGTDTETDCPDASVAGISQMNKYMSDWVCQALENGTQYFWFESFDEPWKIIYDTGSQNWEDHWGLMDVDRNLKAGVSIPDCGGKTVD